MNNFFVKISVHFFVQLEKEFFSQLDNPLLGKAFKLAIIGEWLAANSLDVSFYNLKNIYLKNA